MNDLAEAKQALEIEKLRLELLYIRRNFMVQITNTICLALIGFLVFYFFQRPQIDHLESSRLAAERHQVATLLITAQNIGNEKDKNKMIELLRARPQVS